MTEAPPYTPRGGAADMIRSRAPAVLIDGPVFTGKTMGVLWKGLYCSDQYPRSRILLCRKTRKSLTESVLVTFEEKILTAGLPIVAHGGDRGRRTHYAHANGSVIVCGGMDPGGETNGRASIMSTEWDMALLFESTEFTEDDVQKIRTRVRNGIMPYQQTVMDCNPGSPTHHLIRGAQAGVYQRCPSRHQDNPRMWDAAKGDWTPEGVRYLAVLNTMTGHRLLRLRDGKWTAAEGVVYPEWDSATHVIDPFPIPADWRRFRVVDFGFTNPFVCQWWAQDGDGRLYLYREIYYKGRIVQKHAEKIRELSAGERIEATIADHDAEDRATLAHEGIPTMAARKDVEPGLKAVRARLTPAGDGKPRLFIFRDALVERDPALVEAKKPTCTADEMDGYMWTPDKDGKPVKEAPLKVNDHGADGARYGCMYADNPSVPGVTTGAPRPLFPDLPGPNNLSEWAGRPAAELPYGSPHRAWNRAPRVRY